MVLLVSYEAGVNGAPLLIVGKKENDGKLNILNAFTGIEATTLYSSLTTKAKEK